MGRATRRLPPAFPARRVYLYDRVSPDPSTRTILIGHEPERRTRRATGRAGELTREVANELSEQLPRPVREALGRSREAASEDQGAPQSERTPEQDRETVLALIDLGLDEDEATEAVATGRVPLVLARKEVGDRARFDLDTLARRSGVPAELLREIRVASGLPVPERFSKFDLRWARRIARLLEILPPDAVVRSARARGTALGMVARSDMSIVRDELVLPMRRAGADDLTLSVALAETVKQLDGLASELLAITYDLHLEHQLGTELSALLTHGDESEVELAVGFVDVVGWTTLSSRIDPAGLDDVLDAFEARIIEVTAPLEEVTVIKYLGDAVMLVASDASSLASAMLELTTAVPDLEDVPLRGGLAAGLVRIREGDAFGSPVNLAARLTDLARPWSLLADEQLLDALEGDHEIRRVRPMRIRSIGIRRPLSLRSPR